MLLANVTDRTLEPSGPTLVTGGNGYVGSWVVRRLLELGLEVRATVRDPTDPARTGHLRHIAETSPGSLSLFRADLMEPGAFDEAVAGCQYVFHTASPLLVRGVEDPVRELIEPATRGTRNVLEAVNRSPSVRRVVLTSSVAAIAGDAADMSGIRTGRFDESHWNETSHERHQPYSCSKTRAERLAWEMAAGQDRWDLVTVNPGLVFGPALSPHTRSESVRIMRDFGTGYYRMGVPGMEFGIVDVRDVAEGHVRAGFIPEASGRHILVSESLTLGEIAGVLRNHFGGGFPFPRFRLPRIVVLLLAPFRGVPRAVVRRNVGYPLEFDNRYARTDLGMSFRPAAEAIVDHFQQLLDDGLVQARTHRESRGQRSVPRTARPGP
jgi:nucleoside-diphosphate-sugar epimerase